MVMAGPGSRSRTRARAETPARDGPRSWNEIPNTPASPASTESVPMGERKRSRAVTPEV